MIKFLTDPALIEEQSMKIIEHLLGKKVFPPEEEKIIKRVIHATADFAFARSMVFSPGGVKRACRALQAGGCLLTADTQMIVAGTNKGLLQKLGARLECFVGGGEVAKIAASESITRSMANIRVCAERNKEGIYIIGNAPTALYEVLALAEAGKIRPALVIGVPVGFVGAAESKEALLQSGLPFIAARGRKGGSTVAVAILHALLHLSLEKAPAGGVDC